MMDPDLYQDFQPEPEPLRLPGEPARLRRAGLYAVAGLLWTGAFAGALGIALNLR